MSAVVSFFCLPRRQQLDMPSNKSFINRLPKNPRHSPKIQNPKSKLKMTFGAIIARGKEMPNLMKLKAVIDSASEAENSNNLSLEKNRKLFHEMCKATNDAREVLQSWTRKELIQLINFESGKERKLTSQPKTKPINQLL